MKKILFILSLFILASCSYQKRLNKWCAKCPVVEIHDTTIIKHDSIIYRDSIFTVQLPPLPADTIKILIPGQQSAEIDIALRTYDYDYISVDVWVSHNVINVKPYLNNDTIKVLIRNAKIEVYRTLYEKYKDYKQIVTVKNHVPGIVWILWPLSILIVVCWLVFRCWVKHTNSYN